MKRKAVSALLALILAFALPLSLQTNMLFAFAQGYESGDTFEYGSYPQSLVTDGATLSALEQVSGDFTSYGAFCGTGSRYDGQMAASSYMRYCDTELDGVKYRGVVFDTFRPVLTGLETSAAGDKSYQDDNGFECGTVYWFRYEPVTWRVLDDAAGLVLSETVLDSQAFNDFIVYSPASYDPQPAYSYYGDSAARVFASDYENSSVRAMLNGAFYDTAFSASEKANIAETQNENKCFYTLNGTNGYTKLDGGATADSVFLLSSSEAANAQYGLDTVSARITGATDYAKCMGAYVYKYTGSASDGSTYDKYDSIAAWRLRSAGGGSDFACCVTNGGGIKEDMYLTSETCCGIRPAMRLSSLDFYSVSFDANGGENAPQSEIKVHGVPLTLPESEPSKENADFLGWAEESDASAPAYQPGGEFTADADTVLYALWGDRTPPEATLDSITQNEDGSAVINVSASDTSGISGYYFGTDEDITANPFTPAAGSISVNVTQSGTFYFAVADSSGNLSEVISLTMYETAFDGNSGTPGKGSIVARAGSSVTLPGASRESYVFKGWASSASAAQAQYNEGGSYTVNGDSTLYAVWERVTYTLSFSANGGTGAPAAVTGYGEVNLPASQPSRSGFTFKGWARNSAAASPEYMPGAPVQLTGNMTLYAVWEQLPGIAIKGFTASRGVDYKATVIFTAVQSGNTAGCTVQWYKDGSPVQGSDTLTVKEATSSYSVEVRLIRDGAVIASSGTEMVNVNTGFFAKIIAFFRGLFGRLPVIYQ